MAITLETIARNAACNAIVDLLDSGTIDVCNVGNDVLATCTFSATAFGDAATGVATAASITGDSDIDLTGTADHFDAKRSAGNGGGVVFSGTCGSGSGDMDISPSTSLVATGTFSISSMTVTVPAS